MTDTPTLTMDAFSRRKGQSFTLAAQGSALDITLVEVKPLDHGMREGGAFALLWQGPGEPGLAQGTYEVAHDEIGAHHMFLVPVDRTDDGFQYESVFT